MIVLGIIAMPIIWFQAEDTTQQHIIDNLLQQSDIENIEHRHENMLLYIQNALRITGLRGSDLAGSLSGRTRQEPDQQSEEYKRYRYWRCIDNQIPPTEKIRYTVSNQTEELIEPYLNMYTGTRDQIIHSIGETECIETGKPYPFTEAGPEHSRFKSVIQPENVITSYIDGEVSQSEEKPNITADLTYNRFWYMYNVLRRWVENEDLKDEIRSKMEEVPDTITFQDQFCLESADDCPDVGEPKVCVDQEKRLTRKVNEGLRKEIEKLEKSEEYFNDSHVSCSANTNQKNCFEIYNIRKSTTGSSTEEECGDEEDEKEIYDCRTTWTVDQRAYADFRVRCQDDRYESIPTDDTREKLTWKIRLHHIVEESTATPDLSTACETKSAYEFYDCISKLDGYPTPRCQGADQYDDASICETDIETLEFKD